MAITGKLPTKTDENNVFKIFTVKRTVDSDGTIHNKLEVDLENEIKIDDINGDAINPAKEDGNLSTIAGAITRNNIGSYNQAGVIGSSPGAYNSGTGVLSGISATGLDIYNDSTSNTLTFVLKNSSTVIFTFTLGIGESLTDQVFPTFTEINITGTTPTFRAITRS